MNNLTNYVKRYRRVALSLKYKLRNRLLEIVALLCFVLLIATFTVITNSTKIYNTISNNIEENKAMMLQIKGDYFERNQSKQKIDWHDYDQIRREKQRVGVGEQGQAANFSSIPKDLLDSLFNVNGYNAALSDLISLHRALSDVRPPNCSKLLYKKDLPDVSVILPFHNEHLSVILRTAWSVLKRSPEHLIKEIIFVDDCSNKVALKDEFDEYLKKNIPKGKIVRLTKRSGLIVARQEGAKVAKGQVLVFLDAHCEATVNWLPPLLDVIADDYRVCACPFVDSIDHTTFAYDLGVEGGRGGFDWHLVYRIFFKFKQYGHLSTEPFESPVMVGGLFAISAKFFWELGGYDEGLYIWGGEQFELSFKIWQCGGKMLDVPCSHVGHIYRKFVVNENYEKLDKNIDYICVNLRRVAEVWMDEYKEYYYMRQPECAKQPYGDVSDRIAIRKKLNCKPFKWFMEEVAYDITNRYPVIEPSDIAYGEFRNLGSPDLCVETSDDKVKLNKCNKESWWQTIQFTWRGEIKNEFSKNCWDVTPQFINGKYIIVTYNCHFGGGNQLWKYEEKTKAILFVANGQCVDTDINEMVLFLNDCDETIKTQQWTLDKFNKTQQDKVPDYVKNIVIDEKPKRQ